MRANNKITILLVTIVIMLIVGVFVAIYYVLDLDWFTNKKVQVYEEIKPSKPVIIYKEPTVVNKQISFDMKKRNYDIEFTNAEFKIIVYKDGTLGITMLENEKYNKIKSYNELLNKEIKPSLQNIVRIYEVEVSKAETTEKCIVVLDVEGNLYKLVEKEILTNGKYAFIKIEGMAGIIDIKQITNTNVLDNSTGRNAIAIDKESNELLLTDYILKNK